MTERRPARAKNTIGQRTTMGKKLISEGSRSKMKTLSTLRSHQPAPLLRREAKQSSLPAEPTVRQVRDHIGRYLDIASEGRAVTILDRGKPLCVLASIDLYPDLAYKETVDVTSIRTGEVRFGYVHHRGPYLIKRRGKNTAILFALAVYVPPQPENTETFLLSRVGKLLDELEKMEIILAKKDREVELYSRVHRVVIRELELLKTRNMEAYETFKKDLDDIHREYSGAKSA